MYLTFWMGLCLTGQQGGDHGGDVFASAVHDAFVSNQAAFPYGNIIFTYVKGNAKSDVAARRGEFDPKYTARCLYVYNGAGARYERIFPDEQMRAANKKVGNDIMSIIDTFRMTSNGEVTLYDSITVAEGVSARGIRLSPGTRDFDRDFHFPLALGRPEHRDPGNLGRHLLSAIQGEPSSRGIQVDEHARYEDRDVVHLTLTSTTGAREYWIDLERGAVPLKIVSRQSATDKQAESRVVYHLDDLRLIPGRGWLPFKESWWYSNDHRAYQVVLGEADFDRAPGERSFALDFPNAVTLVDEAKGVRYPPQSTWNVLRLPRPGARGVERVDYARVPYDQVPKLPGEVPARSRYGLLIYGALAIILAVGLMLWRRRLSHG